MLNFLEHMIFWYWLGLAAILLILEVITGSGFLLWIGMSASLVGVALWFVPDLSWITQLLAFAALSIITGLTWWFYLRKNPIRTDHPTLNRRGEQYIGRVFTLDSPIVNGIGKVHVDDTMWRVHCVDAAAGERIRITSVDGVILNAEPEK